MDLATDPKYILAALFLLLAFSLQKFQRKFGLSYMYEGVQPDFRLTLQEGENRGHFWNIRTLVLRYLRAEVDAIFSRLRKNKWQEYWKTLLRSDPERRLQRCVLQYHSNRLSYFNPKPISTGVVLMYRALLTITSLISIFDFGKDIQIIKYFAPHCILEALLVM